MLVVNPTPYSIPLNTAHVPTESVQAQNRFAERVPESVPTSESTKNKGAETEQQLSDSDRAAKNAEAQSQIIGSKDEKSEQEGKQNGETQNTETKGSGDAQSKQEAKQEIQDQAIIRELASIDRKVRAHEQAHASVGGALAGAPSYTYKTGPNGVRYAVAGEVPIQLSPVAGNPKATLSNAEQVRRAALAPADPSPTDRRIASSAQALASKARFEIARLAAEQIQQGRDSVRVKMNGEDVEDTEPVESTISFSGSKLRAALATDATEQVGGQVSASA